MVQFMRAAINLDPNFCVLKVASFTVENPYDLTADASLIVVVFFFNRTVPYLGYDNIIMGKLNFNLNSHSDMEPFLRLQSLQAGTVLRPPFERGTT